MPRIKEILERCLDGDSPKRGECLKLLALDENSYEAGILRATANIVTRQRFSNRAILMAQIGVETFPCDSDCLFCSFGKSHTTLPETCMSDEELMFNVEHLVDGNNVFAVFLMMMHRFNFDRLLSKVNLVRRRLKSNVSVVLNIGDFDMVQAKELKSAGVSGIYHTKRLREGVDTTLSPARREETIKVIKDSGLDWYCCCEPIGPEHTPEELVKLIELGREFRCSQHAAMRRVLLPNSPIAVRGQISELRLAQIVAVVTLGMIDNPDLQSIAVHEPSVLGLTAGANSIYAECGANPRDNEVKTEYGRGFGVKTCCRMLQESGFESLRLSGLKHKEFALQKRRL